MIYREGDVIVSKKVHPCGGNEWVVVRVGADVKLKCLQCGRFIITDYDKVKKITKKYVPADENAK